VVIDVRIDPDIVMPKVDRVAVMATKPKVAPQPAVAVEPNTWPRLRVVN
jgi:hypothetical protein